MQASNVQIDKRLLNSPRLNNKRKTELRRQIVLDLIASKANMEPIALSEIQHACNYSSSGAPVPLLRAMIKDGLIAKHELSPRSTAYTLRNSKTVIPPKAVSTAPTPVKQAEAIKPTASAEARAIRAVVLEFYWQHKSDSLRQFVEWVEQGGADETRA